ncbi:hypothetical protein [Streptomyces sp. NBC_01340]|uniref:hypothetical protein n=1 Tax=Streptomyces sp. NBC_01340 TaxID=2903830 RepID=UPI003DA452C1
MSSLLVLKVMPRHGSRPDRLAARLWVRRPSPAAAAGRSRRGIAAAVAVPAGSRTPYQQSPNLITGHFK